MSDSVEKWVWLNLKGGQRYDVPSNHAWEPGSHTLICREKVGDGVGQRKEVSVANLEPYKITMEEGADLIVARVRAAERAQKEQSKPTASPRKVFLETMREMIEAVQLPHHILWMDEKRTVFYWVPSDFQLPEGPDKLGTIAGWVFTDQSQLTRFQIDRSQANIYAQQLMDARALAEKRVAQKVLELLPEEPLPAEPGLNWRRPRRSFSVPQIYWAGGRTTKRALGEMGIRLADTSLSRCRKKHAEFAACARSY